MYIVLCMSVVVCSMFTAHGAAWMYSEAKTLKNDVSRKFYNIPLTYQVKEQINLSLDIGQKKKKKR